MMRQLGLIERIGRARYRPLGSVAIIQQLAPELIQHVAGSIRRLLHTVQYNVKSGGKSPPLIERAASVLDLPATEVPEFRRFTHQQAKTFLANVDDWLENHRAKGKEGRRSSVKSAGVHVYAYLA
jgi:hypothetical protein